MDVVQDYISLLHRVLPPSVTNPLIQVVTTLFGISRAIQSQVMPLVTQFLAQPDILSVLYLVVILWLSLQILGMAYRTVMAWLRLAWQIVKWGTIVAIVLWVWSKGPEGAVEGAKEMAGVWLESYQRFAGEAKAWKGAEEAQIRFQAGQRGGAGWR